LLLFYSRKNDIQVGKPYPSESAGVDRDRAQGGRWCCRVRYGLPGVGGVAAGARWLPFSEFAELRSLVPPQIAR